MLNIQTKQTIYNYLRPIKIWIDNNGSIYLDEVINDVAEYLDYTSTEEEIEKLLRNICDIRDYGYGELAVKKINI